MTNVLHNAFILLLFMVVLITISLLFENCSRKLVSFLAAQLDA